MGDLPYKRDPVVDPRAIQKLPLDHLDLVMLRTGLEIKRIQQRAQLPENRTEEIRKDLQRRVDWIGEIQEQIGSEKDRRSEMLIEVILKEEGSG